MSDIGQAIKAINSEAAFYITGENIDTIQWLNETAVISKSDIQAKQVELQAAYDAQEYARSRVKEYPSNGDQWDMIYKDNKNGTTTHADAVEAVKTKYPKDNSGN